MRIAECWRILSSVVLFIFLILIIMTENRLNNSVTLTYGNLKIEIKNYPLGVGLILAIGFGMGIGSAFSLQYLIVRG